MRRSVHARSRLALVCALGLLAGLIQPVFVAQPAAAADTTYLSDDFEGGLSAWATAGDGSATTQSTVVNSGTGAAKLSNAAGQYVGLTATLAGGPQAQTYSRFCFNLADVTASRTLAEARDANGNPMWAIVYDAVPKGLDIYFWNGARARTNLMSPANVIAANKWYCAEVQANETTAGHGEVWLNGTSVAATNADLSATNPYSRLILWNNGATGTVYDDDVKVSNAYNGPVGGAGSAPAVGLAPASLSFPSQTVGSTSGAQTVTLTNTGTAPLTLSGIGVTGTNSGDYAQTNTCPTGSSTLAANTTCTINVTFTPTATGTRTANLSVTDNAAGSPHTLALTGTGQTPPGTPTAVAGSPRDGGVALSWTAPSADGGSPITGYRITPHTGATALPAVLTGSSATTFTVNGLTNGTAYTFTVAAINALGTGPDSAPSAPVTPGPPPPAQTVVSLMFDDNQITQYQVRDMLRAHGMHATFYVNSGLTGDQPGWRMSWSQLHDLAADGNEIGGHTLDHADLTQLSAADQRREVCDDRTNILNHGFSPVSSFAYPYGAYEQNNAKAIPQQCGYSSARTVGGIRSSLCPNCPFAESIPPQDPFVVRTPPDVRTPRDTLDTIKAYVTQAEQNGGGWVPILFHYVCDGCDEYSVSASQLQAFLDWLAPRTATGTVVRKVDEVVP